MALETPHRKVLIGRKVWHLYADQRAWNYIELATKKSRAWWTRWAIKVHNRVSFKLQPIYLFLWAFSSKFREEEKESLVLSVEDRVLGSFYPSSFLDLLPGHPDEFKAFQDVVIDMLSECGFVKLEAKEPSAEAPGEAGEDGNPTSTTDPSTGTVDSPTP